MKKILKTIWILGLLWGITPHAMAQKSTEENPIDIEMYSGSAILIDTQSNVVLYEKNALEKKYPASITKILTVILAIEHLEMDELTTVTQEAIDATESGSSHIALQVGEEILIKDLCYATLLASANDAANTLAIAVSGSIDKFANLMNQKAEALGAMNSHFTNPSGLPDEGHYTCAYDMAIITSHAIKNKTFLNIFSTISYASSVTNMQPEKRIFANGNDMVKPSEYSYQYAIGGKNGWTPDAQYTLVTYAEKNGLTLVAVILEASNKENYYQETKDLFEAAFESYQRLMIPHEEIETKVIEIYDDEELLATSTFNFNNDIGLLLPSSMTVEDITHKITVNHEDSIEEIEAILNIYVGGKFVGEVKMDHQQEFVKKETDEKNMSMIRLMVDYLSIIICISAVVSFVYKIIKVNKS